MIFADMDKMKIRIFLPLLLLFGFILSLDTVSALEYVHFKHQGKEQTEEGRVIHEAPEGIAFESRDGQYFVITSKNLLSRKSDEAPFVPYTKTEMIERLQKEFPPDKGFYYLDTHDPFIIVYTTSKPFANWYGNLLKKLHEQYVLHWTRLGVKLTQPEFLMVAIVLSNEERFRQYAKQDSVPLLKEQCAYYHKSTNRIAMYDMSGQQALREGIQRRANAADIQGFLRQPDSYNNIRSVIHEAVHQVGFNTGMHPRFTPNPIWLCESLAVFHEVPDPKNRIGWTLGPHINRDRLEQLKRYLGKPQQESPIRKMIRDDNLFKQPDTALDHYALAWGLTYYLVKKRPKELAAYLAILQEKTLNSDDDAAIRLQEFESCFGDDWKTFDKECFNFLRRL